MSDRTLQILKTGRSIRVQTLDPPYADACPPVAPVPCVVIEFRSREEATEFVTALSELRAMDLQVAELNSRCQALRQDNASLRQRLASLQAAASQRLRWEHDYLPYGDVEYDQ